MRINIHKVDPDSVRKGDERLYQDLLKLDAEWVCDGGHTVIVLDSYPPLCDACWRGDADFGRNGRPYILRGAKERADDGGCKVCGHPRPGEHHAGCPEVQT